MIAKKEEDSAIHKHSACFRYDQKPEMRDKFENDQDIKENASTSLVRKYRNTAFHD